MDKRGFTLAELLGVIFVLGILAVIVVPIIVDNIEESNKNSVIRSAEGIIDTVTLDYTTKDNFTTDKINILSLDFNGEKPESGYIQFNENEKVRLYMVHKGFCVAKRFDSELIAIKLKDTDICDWYTSPNTIREQSTSKDQNQNQNQNQNSTITLNLKEGNLLNYKIYGNSYQFKTPSTEFPSQIQSLGNTNLIDFFNIESQQVFPDVEGNPAKKFYVINKLEPGRTYTLSYTFKNDSDSVNYLYLYKSDGNTTTLATYLTTYNNIVKKDYVFTPEEGYYYLVGQGGKTSVLEQNEIDKFDTFHVQAGEGATAIKNKENFNKYGIDIKVYGENLLDNKKFISSGTHNGVKYELGSDGGYTAKGNTTGSMSWLNIFNDKALMELNNKLEVGKTYYFRTFNESESGNKITYRLFVDIIKDGKHTYLFSDRQNYFTLEEGAKINSISVRIYDDTGVLNSAINTKFLPMLVKGENPTDYEIYKENSYSLTLDEPLRCINDVCDYIDYDNEVVVRNIKVIDDSGEKTIEESFEKLTVPKNEKIELPKIETLDGVNNILVFDGNLSASKIEIIGLKK